MERKYRGLCFFEPWIGNNYQNGGIFNKKVLVLGESHICGSDECNGKCGFKDFPDGCNPNFTKDTVLKYLDHTIERDNWMRTYLKFERSLVGHETGQEDSEAIWNSIAFYNYLQVAMNESRKAGTSQDYIDAQKPFLEVLEELQPDLVIVWGVTRLFTNMPEEGWEWSEPLSFKDYPDFYIQNGYYKLKSGLKTRVIPVYHPSVGYDWSWWYNEVINKVLKLKK